MVKYISLDCPLCFLFVFMCMWDINWMRYICRQTHRYNDLCSIHKSVVWPIFSHVCVSLFFLENIEYKFSSSLYGRIVRAPSRWGVDSFRRIHGKLDPPYPGEMLCSGSLVEWPFSLVCILRSILTALNGERQRHLDSPQSWGHVGLDWAITPSRHTDICICFSEGLALCLSFSTVLCLSLSLFASVSVSCLFYLCF